MALLHDDTETEMKCRILATAERLFRDIGYLKTTVADIAKTLKMSPANIYRFFDSKKAIHEGVARRLMAEVEDAAEAIAAKPTPPVERLKELLATVSVMNAERFVGDAKITRWSPSRWKKAGMFARLISHVSPPRSELSLAKAPRLVPSRLRILSWRP
jgi:AcrR family transcriptional regulator